jgi:hypothetical protein
MRHTGHRRATLTAPAGLLGSGAHAQSFTPSFRNDQTYAQRTVGYVAATGRPDFTLRVVQQALTPQAAPVTYSYSLSKTDFAFKGNPTQQQTCTAVVRKSGPVCRSASAQN